MKSTLAFAVAMSFSAAAHAAPETYVIDNDHTFPRFEYSHLGYSTQQSRFDKTAGTVMIDLEAQIGSVDIKIDARSVNTGSTVFNQHIQGEDFFDTKKYQEIVYTSNDFRFNGMQLAEIHGQLTLKGVSKPVVLTVTSFKCMMHPMAKKEACGANATAVLKRSDFNMGKYAPFVSDEVKLTIAIEVIKP